MIWLLIDGVRVDIGPGVEVVPPRAHPWVKLVKFRARRYRVQQAIVHKTMADDPERILTIPGPRADCGGAGATVRYWRDRKDDDGNPDPASGTQLIAGHNGVIVQTEDLVKVESQHCHTGNERSYGIEIKEHADGRVHLSALTSALDAVWTANVHLGIQLQVPREYVDNKPLRRFLDEHGRDLVGIFGHRDCTTKRNRNDPGDAWFGMSRARGAEAFDFAAREDLDVWSKRQERLHALGFYRGAIDGIAGAGTTHALEQAGYPHGIYALGARAAEQPIPV